MAKQEYLHIRITEELKRQAERLAEEEGQGLSEWLRDLIKKEIWKRKESL